LIREGQTSTGCGELLGNGPGDAIVIRDAYDQGGLSLQVSHGNSSVFRAASHWFADSLVQAVMMFQL
jgi:hypothetical protein